jgi:hypothetical protein
MALGALTAFVLTNFLGLAVFVAGLFFVYWRSSLRHALRKRVEPY